MQPASPSRPLPEPLERFASALDAPGDAPDVRFRNRVALLLCAVGAPFTVLLALADLTAGQRLGAGMMIGSAALLLGGAGWLLILRSGSLAIIWMVLAITQVPPWINTLRMGGFAASAAEPVWALLGPLGALLFVGRRAAAALFASFVTLLAISAYQTLHGPPLQPTRALAVALVMNVVPMSTLIVLVLGWFVTVRSRMMSLLDLERERNERLLLDVLPREVATALKEGSASVAMHDQATVLFADLVGFTPLAATTEPQVMVRMLDEVFGAFDALAERHGLEKIKTIGDCYMAAAGVPRPRADHAAAAARFALEVRELLEGRTFQGQRLAFRIGIHSGPVIAGVIGKKRFLYDLWGDTVNLASRMEQHGEPGQVQVSPATAALLEGHFDLEPRGEVEVKGKGRMRLWWVKRRSARGPSRPAAS